MSYRFSPKAEADLAAIGDVIAVDNLAAARRFVAMIEAKCLLLAQYPQLGPAREDLAPGLRCLPVGRYLLLYRVLADAVEIVRVVHGARYLPDLLP